jgi:hypothetical protein
MHLRQELAFLFAYLDEKTLKIEVSDTLLYLLMER